MPHHAEGRTELEAKFAVPDRPTFEALKQMQTLGSFKLKPGTTKTIQDRYLDDANNQLLRAGYACRIRKVGTDQKLYLKTVTSPTDHIHRRQEFDMQVETIQPQRWPAGTAKRLVLEIIGKNPLRTLFVIYQTRHIYYARLHDKPIIEVSLDEVSLQDSSPPPDYFELEAELLETGSEADLLNFTAALQQHWPLKAEPRSKFERALLQTGS